MYTHVTISILVLDLHVSKSHSFVCYAGESQVNAASHNDMETVCTRYITGEWKVPVRLYWWRLCMISWTFMDMTWEEKVPALLPWLLWWCITDTIVAAKLICVTPSSTPLENCPNSIYLREICGATCVMLSDVQQTHFQVESPTKWLNMISHPIFPIIYLTVTPT